MYSQDVADHPLSPSPTDGITALAWSPVSEHIAVASWDGQVRVYEIADTDWLNIASAGMTAQSRPLLSYAHDAPILDLTFTRQGNKIVTGGTDNNVKVYDVTTQQPPQIIGKHDAPVKCVKVMDENVIVTASWDKTIRYWDLRTPGNPIATLQLPERAYAMDINHPVLTVACADRKICIVHLGQPQVIYKTLESSLKWQSRAIVNSFDQKGFCISSIEGRIALMIFNDTKPVSEPFSFKCHRVDKDQQNRPISPPEIYPVNCLTIHPSQGTIVSGGGDGTLAIWDVEKRGKCKSWDKLGRPITAAQFNRDGRLLAYSLSYDWGKGYSGRVAGQEDTVMIKTVHPDAVAKKKA